MNPRLTNHRPVPGRFFYGWRIVAVAFLCNFMATGTAFYLFNAFLEPLVQERGFTYTQVNRNLAIGPAVGLAAQLIYGTLVVKTGPRLLMAIGPVLSGLSFIMMGRAESLSRFYLLYVLLCLGNGAMSGLVSGTAVNNWFVKKRGAAMGVATAGISLSGVVMPGIAMWILNSRGLAAAYAWIGGVLLFLSPLAWLIVRDWPEDHGLLPDGADPGNPQELLSQRSKAFESAGEPGKEPEWKFSSLIRERVFWQIGLSYMLILTGVSGVMSQLKPRFAHVGFSEGLAMTMMSATALMGFFGKFFWGMLCDRFEPRRVVSWLMTGGGVGLALLLIKKPLAAYAFVGVYGFCMGGVLSTLPIMVGHFFGRRSFPTVVKYLAAFMALQGIGPEAMGQSMDRFGSYDPAYFLFTAFTFAAAFMVYSLKKSPAGGET